MTHRAGRRTLAVFLVSAAALAATATPAVAVPAYDFATPVFGLAAQANGALFAADTGAGVVRLTADGGRLALELPGVTDVAPLRRGRMWALTSAPHDRNLYLVVKRRARVIANVGAFERAENPDGGDIDSNPFDLARLGRGEVLIADAAANAVLIANRDGSLDWVATLPDEVVSTANAKALAGCPNAPPELADACDLPDTIPAQPVSTSVAVGPDGAYYVTELKGFPAPLGESRIWRIEPGTLHAQCDAADTESPCTVVADGFTSIVDLAFGPDGTAYVTELDEASWFAVEVVQDAMAGGTIDACTTTAATWSCIEEATDLTMPMAVAVPADVVFVLVSALVPGEADVVQLP